MLQTRKLTDTRERFPFLRSIVEIVEISDVQRKAKTLLIYIFITVLLFCFYIILVNINCCRSSCKVTKVERYGKIYFDISGSCESREKRKRVFLFRDAAAQTKSNEVTSAKPKLRIFFRTTAHLWITFPIIIFPSLRPTDRATVDTQPRRRNLRVDKNHLAGRRGFCNFVGRITLL